MLKKSKSYIADMPERLRPLFELLYEVLVDQMKEKMVEIELSESETKLS